MGDGEPSASPRLETRPVQPDVPLYSKCIAEFVGTFLLIFTVGCNALMAPPEWGVTSIASMLMVSIYALAGVSGANFNPAVTVALVLSRKMDRLTGAIYIVVQLIAGILAGFSYYILCGKAFTLEINAGWWELGAAEVLYTFMLCFVVLNVACSNCPNQFYGLAIGFVIVAGGYGAGSVSTFCINPAVAFGIDVSSAHMGFGWSFAYAGFELLGAALASGLHRFVRPREYSGIFRRHAIAAKIVSEFLGTFFLVLTVGFNVLAKSKAGAFSIAASLMCMIYALGDVSGGHFNPAVTLAILLSGRAKMGEDFVEAAEHAGLYMLVQILGAIFAGVVYSSSMDHSFELAPQPSFHWGHVAVAEIVFTFVLCYVVLCVATTKDPSQDFFGLAIGLCVVVGGCAIGAISLGSLNPAVSFGIATSHFVRQGHSHIVKGILLWLNCLVYTAFEFIGALLAAGVFRATHAIEYDKGAKQPFFFKRHRTGSRTEVKGSSTHNLQEIYNRLA